MWNKYKPKIGHLIKSKYTVSVDFRSKYFEDLLLAGQLALYKAFESFDETKTSSKTNDPFWAYARKYVEGGLKDELNRNLGSVYAPRRIKRLANKIKKLFPEIQDRHQIALEVGCSLEEIHLAEDYLNSKDVISLDSKLRDGRDGDKELSLIDYISDSRDQYNDILIFDFVQTLDLNERCFFNRLYEGSSTSEIVKEGQFEDWDADQLLASIQTKLLKYLNLDYTMQEELKMSIKKSNAKPIAQNDFNELVKQGVPINEIARRYRMSPATLRKRRSEWDETSVKEGNEPRGEHVNQRKEVVSVEEYQKLLNDYQNLKIEHSFLWQYLKQLLSRMDTPFSLNQK